VLIRHNQKSKFYSNVNDWKVVHIENTTKKELAQKGELQIKSWKSRIKIQEFQRVV
jgi:putative endonuclease